MAPGMADPRRSSTTAPSSQGGTHYGWVTYDQAYATTPTTITVYARHYERHWQNPSPRRTPALDRPASSRRILRHQLELALLTTTAPAPRPRPLLVAPRRTEARPRERRTVAL
jgi:hypothetical protein